MVGRVEEDRLGRIDQALAGLYQELPPVSCTSCGKCCASPHITFVETLHLFTWLFESCSTDDLESWFNAEMVEQSFAFNFKCRFEDPANRLCRVHPSRGFICRVFGYPVLDRMGIDNMDNCREPDRPVLPDVRRSRMTGWLDRLAELNRIVSNEFNRPPYCVTGLNIETWLDIAVTDYGRQPFRTYHETLRRLPFDRLRLKFQDRTDLSTRLAKIDILGEARRAGNETQAQTMAGHLLSSEPRTGTFYRYEAGRHIDSIRR